MPNYVSKLGKFIPAKERVVLSHMPRGKEIYEGLDRAALYEMHKAGHIDKEGNISDYFGESYKEHEHTLEKARSLGYNTVEEYLKVKGFNEKKALAEFEETHGKEVDHDARKVQAAINELAGGKDETNSENNRTGDFGLPPELSGNKKD